MRRKKPADSPVAAMIDKGVDEDIYKDIDKDIHEGGAKVIVN